MALILVFVVLALLRSVWRVTVRHTHLLPAGYTGPVVIVYGDPMGITLESSLKDGQILEFGIPPVLHVKTPLQRAFYCIDYYYIDADGNRTPIATVGTTEPRVFARVAGAEGTVFRPDGKPIAEFGVPLQYKGYMGGRPVPRTQWDRELGTAISAALGRNGPPW